jgi:hypothetical protein
MSPTIHANLPLPMAQQARAEHSEAHHRGQVLDRLMRSVRYTASSIRTGFGRISDEMRTVFALEAGFGRSACAMIQSQCPA